MDPTNPTQQPQPPAQPEQPYQPPDQGVKVHNPLSVMQTGERNICEIKRHPIGIIGVYVGAGLLLVLLAVLAFGVVPHFAGPDNQNAALQYGSLGFLVITVLTLIFVFISNKVYWGNSWILTTDSLTQVTQNSLFDKQSSQLSLGNLEDVTASKDGILAHIFNYGIVKVETAGERSKFVCYYCPNPEQYAQQILKAREDFEQFRTNIDNQRQYNGQGSYQEPGGVNLNTQQQ